MFVKPSLKSILSFCVLERFTITFIDPVKPPDPELNILRGENSTVVLDLCSGSIFSIAIYHFLRSRGAREHLNLFRHSFQQDAIAFQQPSTHCLH